MLALLLAACGPSPEPTQIPATPINGVVPTQAPPIPTATNTTVPPPATNTVAPTNTVVKKTYNIGILQTSTHPALDLAQAGIKQAFTDAGLKEGADVNFDVRNAELDATTAATMADGFITANVDAIVTIGSLTSAAALAATINAKSNIPIIFCAVADPYLAGLAGKKESDGSVTPDPLAKMPNLTGVSAFPPVLDGLRIIGQVKPGVKTIGLLWNPQEPNSQATTEVVRKAAADLGLTLIDRTASKPADTLAAAETLAGFGVEAIFVSTTNSVVNGIDGVVRVAEEKQIPLFGNDPLSASRGAVAAVGLDYKQNGMQAGQMALDIVSGKSTAKDLPITTTTASALCINTKAAELQGVTLPDTIVAQAQGCTYNEIRGALPGITPTATP